MARRYALRDDQWERIKELLPGKEGDVGVTSNSQYENDSHEFMVLQCPKPLFCR